MIEIDAKLEREFANELGYLDGAGPEIQHHLHNMVDTIERLENELVAATLRIENDNATIFNLMYQRDLFATELHNIVHAKRFDIYHFGSDTVFADWAQSRASFTLSKGEAK